MIVDAILNFFLSPILLLLDNLPTLEISVNVDFTKFFEYITLISSVIPLKELIPILIIKIAITSFSIIWAIVLRVKSFIPTMGA